MTESLASAAARAKASGPNKFGFRECKVLLAVKTYVDAGGEILTKVLTGFSAGAGTVSAADTVLGAFQKIDANSKLASTAICTGFSSGAGSVAGTDTVLQAINKLDGNIALKKASSAFSSGTTGSSGTAGQIAIAGMTAAGAVLVTPLEDISATPFSYVICGTGLITIYDTTDTAISSKKFGYAIISLT